MCLLEMYTPLNSKSNEIMSKDLKLQTFTLPNQAFIVPNQTPFPNPTFSSLFVNFEKSSWWWVHKVKVHNTSLKELEVTTLYLTSTCLLYILYRPHETFYGLGLALIKRKNELGPFYRLPQHGLESLNIKNLQVVNFHLVALPILAPFSIPLPWGHIKY